MPTAPMYMRCRGLFALIWAIWRVAEFLLLDALIVDPFYVPALTVLGTVLQERGDLEGALSVYRQAWVLDLRSAGIRVVYGAGLCHKWTAR